MYILCFFFFIPEAHLLSMTVQTVTTLLVGPVYAPSVRLVKPVPTRMDQGLLTVCQGPMPWLGQHHALTVPLVMHALPQPVTSRWHVSLEATL